MRNMETQEKVKQGYPNLTKAIEEAPTFVRNGYLVNAFSFGEYGSSIEPELADEIVGGLAEKIRPVAHDVNYLIPLAPGGARWGLVIAYEVGIDVKPTHLKREGPLYQVELEDEIKIGIGGPHSRELRRGVKQGDKAIILDDVISTGRTVLDVVGVLKQNGVQIEDIFSIVTKGDEYRQIEETIGATIHDLVHLSKEGQIIDLGS